MSADKSRAIKSMPRISEKTLFVIAWIGGSIGIYIGVWAFRHKTKHSGFTIGIPAIMVVQIVAVALVAYYIKFHM